MAYGILLRDSRRFCLTTRSSWCSSRPARSDYDARWPELVRWQVDLVGWLAGWLVGSESRGKLVRPFCTFSTPFPHPVRVNLHTARLHGFCTDAGATLWPLSLRILTIIDGDGSGLSPLYTSLGPFADRIVSFVNFAMINMPEDSTCHSTMHEH